MQFTGGTQWMDNIYFRLQRSNVDTLFGALEVAWDAARECREPDCGGPDSGSARVACMVRFSDQGKIISELVMVRYALACCVLQALG